jgi:hypothetical protein
MALGTAVTDNNDADHDDHDDNLPVWVDGQALRRFVSCQEDLAPQLFGKGPLLRHKHLQCDHVGLHPRVARRGKLLPRPIYNAYVSLLQRERALLRQETKGNGSKNGGDHVGDIEEPINDCLITPEANLYCETCSQSYRDELSTKLELAQNLKRVYGKLDGKDDCSLEYDEDDAPSCPQEEFAYTVSRPFITKLKRQITAMIKTLANLDDGTTLPAGGAGSLIGREAVVEGLDAMDLSNFQFDAFSTNGKEAMANGTANSDYDRLDEQINSSITCEFGIGLVCI